MTDSERQKRLDDLDPLKAYNVRVAMKLGSNPDHEVVEALTITVAARDGGRLLIKTRDDANQVRRLVQEVLGQALARLDLRAMQPLEPVEAR